jgi:iron complex outermembrane receptor protein
MLRFLSTLLFLISFNILWAQTDTLILSQIPDTIYLKETIIKAYKADRKTPITFTNLEKYVIEKVTLGQEPSQILGSTPSVSVYSDAGNYQGYSYFRLRGIDQTRINMTLDGIPLNEPEDQGVYFSNYPDFFNSLESIQIQRGVGTSTNGVASYAGSINFSSPDLKGKREAQIGTNYGSYNTFRIFGEFQSGIKNNKSIYARISHIQSDGYKYHSGNNSNSVFLSSALYKNKHVLKFMGFFGNQVNELSWIGVPMDTIKQDSKTNGNSIEKDRFGQVLGSIQHTYPLSNTARLNTAVYYNYLKGNYDFDLNNFLGLPLNEEMYNYAFVHHFKGFFSNLHIHRRNMNFYTGIHMNSFNRSHTGSEKTLGELYQNTGYKNELSLFSKINYRFGKVYLFGDIQFRHTGFNYDGSVELPKLNWNFINPKAGINIFLSRETNLYYSIGSNGREPTRNDIFNGEDDLLSDSEGNTMYSEVEPERVFNQEIGIKTNHTNWYFNTNLYWMKFNNEIVLNGQFGPNGLPLHSNVAKSTRSGIEVDYGIKFLTMFNYNGNAMLSSNKIVKENVSIEPILSPSVLINQEISIEMKQFSIGLSTKYQSSSYIDFENSIQLPSYLETNLRLSYTLKSLIFRTGINNLTDTEIFTNGYIGIDGTPLYFIQCPRNYYIALTWKI